MAGDACVDVEAAFTQAVLALLKVELDLPSPTLSPALPFLVKLHAGLKGPLEEGLKNGIEFPDPN